MNKIIFSGLWMQNVWYYLQNQMLKEELPNFHVLPFIGNCEKLKLSLKYSEKMILQSRQYFQQNTVILQDFQ